MRIISTISIINKTMSDCEWVGQQGTTISDCWNKKSWV